METKIYNAFNPPTMLEKKQVVDFLFENLEQYGDKPEDIEKAINYSIKEGGSFGGFTLVGIENNKILGAVVVNITGMTGYIPENILVYIATHKETRGKGVGKALLEKTIETADGDIALHVEPDNPAKGLYEKYGFKNKYLEMRLKRGE